MEPLIQAFGLVFDPFVLAVMAQRMVPFHHPRQRDDAATAAEVIADEPRRVGLQRQSDQVAHHLLPPDEIVGVADVDRPFRVDFRLGALGPRLARCQPPLQITHAGKIGLQTVFVPRPQFSRQSLSIFRHQVHDAPPFGERPRCRGLLFG